MWKRLQIIFGLLLLGFAVWLYITPIESIRIIVSRLDNIAYDMQLRTKVFIARGASKGDVAIVDIDDKSLNQEGRWPWPRSKIAQLIEDLQKMGVAVVAMDQAFPEAQSNIANEVSQTLQNQKLINAQTMQTLKKIEPFFNNDIKLANSLKKIDSVLGIAFFLKSNLHLGNLPPPVEILDTGIEKNLDFITVQGYLTNLPLLQQAAKSEGYMNVFADHDGVIRRQPLVLRYQDKLYPSLALEATRLFLLSKITLITKEYGDMQQLEGIKLGDYIIPTNSKGEVIIPFRGAAYTFPYFSATDILKKKVKPGALQGSLVFIGTSAIGLGDLQNTAVQSGFPGVEIQANIADGILSSSFPIRPTWASGAELTITVILGVILSFMFPYLGPRLLMFLMILIPFVITLLNHLIWKSAGLILSPLIPISYTIALGMFNMLFGYLFESRRKDQIKQMFGQYVPVGHIEQMLKGSGSYALFGEDRIMTVLFADIRNFTTLSEDLTASQVKDLLDHFFTPMTEIVFEHQGTIDKYVGDMLMAFWGAPLKDIDHTRHALNAALKMEAEVIKLQKEFEERGWPHIVIGIGLNSGEMSVGDMGSKFRRNYTVLGDAVNLASRLENLTKFYGVSIIVSESMVENQKENFIFRHVDRVRVKGKKQGVNIYELICQKEALTEEIQNELQLHQEALNYYFNRDWQRSRELFSDLKRSHPNSHLYDVFIKRIDHYKKVPPPDDWGGTFIQIKKE